MGNAATQPIATMIPTYDSQPTYSPVALRTSQTVAAAYPMRYHCGWHVATPLRLTGVRGSAGSAGQGGGAEPVLPGGRGPAALRLLQQPPSREDGAVPHGVWCLEEDSLTEL